MRSLDRKNKSFSSVNVQHIRNDQKRASTRMHGFISCSQGCDINVVVHRISKVSFPPFLQKQISRAIYFYPDNAPTIMFSIFSDIEISEMLIPRNIYFFEHAVLKNMTFVLFGISPFQYFTTLYFLQNIT